MRPLLHGDRESIMAFELDTEQIAADNRKRLETLQDDYDHLGRQLVRRGVDIEKLTERAMAFRVAVPSWGVGTGGTRFARFPGPGEPRNIFEKLEDCEVVCTLVRSTPGISLHLPWDRPDSMAELRRFAESRGLFFDSINSNTFQDQPDQKLSYKFGSLAHIDSAVRLQAIEHNLECLAIGAKLGVRAHTVWIGDAFIWTPAACSLANRSVCDFWAAVTSAAMPFGDMSGVP